jgi:hypothetical protein
MLFPFFGRWLCAFRAVETERGPVKCHKRMPLFVQGLDPLA